MKRLVATAVVLACSPAFADINNVEADRLFKEALSLKDVNPIQACAKFAESLKFNPQAIGTRLNVARCDEDQGRIASAAEKYSEVADRAREQQLDDFRQEAEARLAIITPEIPHLTLSFAVPPPDGARVVVDDKVVTLTGASTRIAIDPGERKIAVTAPGRVTHVMTLVVAKRDDKPVVLPGLQNASGSRVNVGKIGVLSGGGLLATGIVVGLVARSRYLDAKSRCQQMGSDLICNSDDLRALDRGKTLGNVGTVLGVSGVVVGLAGGALWWRSSRDHVDQRATGVTRIEVFGGPSTGVAVHGRF